MKQDVSSVNIAVIGTGLIGQRHARILQDTDALSLFATVDPATKPTITNKHIATSHFSSFDAFLDASDGCEGVVIATPNDTHFDIASRCMEKGLACLIEKPLAANSQDALGILKVSEQTKTQVLVGHHRRHHLVSQNLRDTIDKGALGQIVGAQLCWMLKKPDDYFAAGDWRTKSGGGPVWINLIHEIDLLRYFMGEIVEVSAMLSNAIRKTEAEDTGVLNMRFENGAIASAILSDTAPSPWHFEGGSGENPNIASTGQDALRIFGTTGSISFPSMTHWSHQDGNGHWGTDILSSRGNLQTAMGGEVALTAQLKHFADVIQKKAMPLVSARDGLQSVRVVEAIHQSAKTGKAVSVST